MTAPSPADRQAAEYAAAIPEAERIAREIVGAEPARWCVGLISAALAAARADEREKALRPVLELCAAADQRVRLAVPASAAERLITSGTHTVQVGDLRRAAAAAGPTHEGDTQA